MGLRIIVNKVDINLDDGPALGPHLAAVAVTCPMKFDCRPLVVPRMAAPLLTASGITYSSLRILFPPNARPELLPSRLIQKFVLDSLSRCWLRSFDRRRSSMAE